MTGEGNISEDNNMQNERDGHGPSECFFRGQQPGLDTLYVAFKGVRFLLIDLEEPGEALALVHADDAL
jgi:hypothetical protein